MAKVKLPTDDEMEEAAIAAAFRRQIGFWLIAAVLLGIFVYVFSDILLPFVAGMVLAYFLDPVADWLERAGLSRIAATLLILLSFIVALTVALIILIPVLASQLADFLRLLPDYVQRLQSLVTRFDPE